jgi:hypothetical protein
MIILDSVALLTSLEESYIFELARIVRKLALAKNQNTITKLGFSKAVQRAVGAK